MRAIIEINPAIINELAKDKLFAYEVILNFTNEQVDSVWIDNTIENNDEQTFRVQCLNLIEQHYKRIYNDYSSRFEIAYKEKDKKYLASFLIKYGPTLNLIASIVIEK